MSVTDQYEIFADNITTQAETMAYPARYHIMRIHTPISYLFEIESTCGMFHLLHRNVMTTINDRVKEIGENVISFLVSSHRT